MFNARSSVKTRLRRAAVIPAFLAGLLGSSILIATPAAAAVPGLGLTTAISPVNNTDKASITTCPPGKKLTGTGTTEFFGAGGEVIATQILPLGNNNQVSVTGREDANVANNWFFQVYAICANPLAGQNRAVQTVAVGGAAGSNQVATATCPGGTKLTGTGAEIIGGGNDVLIDDITPNGALTAVTVTGWETTPTNAIWSVRAVALCANQLPGQVRVQAASPATPVNKSVTATCPAGTQVIGTGGFITGGVGLVGMNGITPNANSVTVRATEVNPTNAAWTVTADAICAIP